MKNTNTIKTIAILLTLLTATFSSHAVHVSKKQPPIVGEDVVVASSEVITTEPEDESLLEKMMNLLSF